MVYVLNTNSCKYQIKASGNPLLFGVSIQRDGSSEDTEGHWTN